MNRPTVVHLIDDTTAGGVMRVIDHIMTAPTMSDFARHSVQQVDRNRYAIGSFDADIIVSHLAISWRALPMLMALRLRHPRAALVHVEHSYTKGFVDENVAHKRRFSTLLRLAYRLFDRIVAVSDAQAQWLRESGVVRKKCLSVIKSCVDLSAFRALAPTDSSTTVFGAIGRLDRQKGFDVLIQAFRKAEAPDIALHIYGEGDEESHLRDLAAGDPRIHFYGFVENPVNAMRAVDVVAMPSRWEAYGLVAIETLSAGRDLLVCDIDGLRDHLFHGATLVAEGQVRDWTAAINEWAVNDARGQRESQVSDGQFERCFSDSWRDLVATLWAIDLHADERAA